MTQLTDFSAKLEIQFGLGALPDKFEVKALFSLPPGSEINPLSETIRISLKIPRP